VRGQARKWQSDRRRLTEKLASPLVLFRVRQVDNAERLYGGWSYRSERFETVMVDGDHFTMLDPGHVDSLVAKLERAVRDAEANPPQSPVRKPRAVASESNTGRT
jgi:thioesterase domain-containing protein